MPHDFTGSELLAIAKRLNEFSEANAVFAELDQAELDTQTASGLIDSFEICGLRVKPPSITVISLLSTVESPLLNPEKPCAIKDIIEALFIIVYREKIANFIYKPLQIQENLKRAESIASKSPEMFEKYLNAVCSQYNGVYNELLTRFGDALGAIDRQQAIIQIMAYLAKSFGVLSMIPKSGGDEGLKKN